MRDKVTLMVGTCDSYSHLWNNFFILLERYWKVDCEIILVGETIPSNKEVIDILPGKLPWGERMLLGLEKVKTPYVIFLLEDYYLNRDITEQYLEKEFSLLNEHKAAKIVFDQIYPPDVYQLDQIKDNLYSFQQYSHYRNTMQPSIQSVEYLKKVLKPDHSPWCYELRGNQYSSELNETILLDAQDRIYFNVYRRGGVWENGALEFLKSESLTP